MNDKFKIEEFCVIADVLYYEGPFISILENEIDKNYYIFKWCDVVDEKYNRWLIFKIYTEQIKKYLTGHISLLEIIFRSPDNQYLLCDIDNDREIFNERILTFNDISTEYLPSVNSHFKKEYSGISEEDWNILEQKFLI